MKVFFSGDLITSSVASSGVSESASVFHSNLVSFNIRSSIKLPCWFFVVLPEEHVHGTDSLYIGVGIRRCKKHLDLQWTVCPYECVLEITILSGFLSVLDNHLDRFLAVVLRHQSAYFSFHVSELFSGDISALIAPTWAFVIHSICMRYFPLWISAPSLMEGPGRDLVVPTRH